ncbi:rhodanese-like domain-containing protein [Cryobacterium sp. TMT1-21]|uniref:Rhodanese-like domain-containing protein n=1 Tax=Cryobacterium shii TaxID=1259235 RepID=A0AAQ2C8G6_9MICO|nr:MULTISPECIES: rhodanese-like domain-containing protein [Cryobacterium]TFC52191.1 rhodanese-like domain-containing protein [Cryobacterium shii]TFC84744.1 rhodanese-like domain-containing protein [Cryobacterium sp. TmT2-59]TFD14531.1 rhodanese-like domain-containing protein [Cryobacterium sp. TMT4-10]TFD15682.1 rhodanese-like domain-containing protein [Cryobacterium sp. TMT1-21]TFD18981.1 rhodanese-like domain-containing protein [Cryobacterium sp. TMT2-23]
MKTFFAALALASVALFGLTACSAAAPAAPPVALAADAVVIDVRTPGEFSAGHLEGAVNIDVQSPDFDSRMAPLPTDGDYLVYCQSGNRSSAAAARLAELGYTSVTDGGGISAAASSTGLAVVTTP